MHTYMNNEKNTHTNTTTNIYIFYHNKTHIACIQILW